MSWAIFGTSVEWSRGERSITASEWARQVASALVSGIAPVTMAEAR